LQQIAKCAIKVELVNDSLTELKGEIAGPPDTPYEGGNFVLEIKVPETYPFNPPKVSWILKSVSIKLQQTFHNFSTAFNFTLLFFIENWYKKVNYNI